MFLFTFSYLLACRQALEFEAVYPVVASVVRKMCHVLCFTTTGFLSRVPAYNDVFKNLNCYRDV